jgi:hypothetical protein
MSKTVDKNTASSSSLNEKIKKIMDKEDENFIENESFEDRWEKAIPAEKVFDKLEKKVRDLWQK